MRENQFSFGPSFSRTGPVQLGIQVIIFHLYKCNYFEKTIPGMKMFTCCRKLLLKLLTNRKFSFSIPQWKHAITFFQKTGEKRFYRNNTLSKNGSFGWEIPKFSWNLISRRDFRLSLQIQKKTPELRTRFHFSERFHLHFMIFG